MLSKNYYTTVLQYYIWNLNILNILNVLNIYKFTFIKVIKFQKYLILCQFNNNI